MCRKRQSSGALKSWDNVPSYSLHYGLGQPLFRLTSCSLNLLALSFGIHAVVVTILSLAATLLVCELLIKRIRVVVVWHEAQQAATREARVTLHSLNNL